MILFVHGANVDENYLTPEAYPLLRRLTALAPVETPLITGDWLAALDTHLAPLGPEDHVVGHSHGGAMALKWIAERAPAKRLASFTGCAIPLWGQPDWEMDEFCLPGDLSGAFTGLARIELLHAADDEVVDPSHAALYAALLPGAGVHVLSKGGHDLENDATTAALAEALAISG